MMNDIWDMVVVFVAGLILGSFLYGGLWWTLKKLSVKSRPFLWLFLSSWLRIGISLVGFYIISNGDWTRFTVCFVGFITARIIISRMIYKLEKNTSGIE